jgi:Asp-tRNA(Asn)/Glu-tRNA(Gln) amidotransferase A subunit family amidase
MAELTDLSLAHMRQSLRGGEFSSRELTMSFIERIEREEPALHAFITLTTELALEQAVQADRRLANWRRNPQAPCPQC